MIRRVNFVLAAALLVFMHGCSPSEYARQADKAAYSTLKDGQCRALGQTPPFDAGYRPLPMVAASQPTTATATQPASAPAATAGIALGDKVIPIGGEHKVALTLDECLYIAFRNSRPLQDRKEQLYVAALALANARRGWDAPLFDGPVTGSASDFVVNGGSPRTALAGTFGPSLTQRLRSGGVLVLAGTLAYAGDLLHTPDSVKSLLSANFTQPLARGAWNNVAYEAQYRLERNFVLTVFDYERFTQTYAVSIVNEYYQVLQARDRCENEADNIGLLKQTVALTRLQVQAGLVSQIELDQAEQNLLDAKLRLEDDLQSYRDQLDQYKLTLGLPMEAVVDVDYPAALDAINKAGPLPVSIQESQATEIAFSTRPDVLTQRAALRDAKRDIDLAADRFLPQIDLVGRVAVPSAGQRDFWASQFNRNSRSLTVNLDYNIDQTDNRDLYRRSLIAADKATRDYAQFVDSVKLQVRKSYRSLLQTKVSYDLQARSVQIAKRRSKLAALQQREGLASARDVLDADDALRTAQNGLTAALVGYTITRLQFLADMGMLVVDESGAIHERKQPDRFDVIERRYPYLGH